MKLKTLRQQSQRDVKWSNVFLGYNTSVPYNIGNYGCLITCFANYIDKSPIEVNDILKSNNGFVNGGELVWGKVNTLGINEQYCSPRYETAVSSQGISKMKELLDNRYPLITEIDFNPTTLPEEMHYVLIIGYEDNTFYCLDPWTGTVVDLSVYGGVERTVYRFRAYDKKLDKETDELQECLNQHTVLVDLCNQKDREIESLKQQLGEKVKVVSEQAEQLLNIRADLNSSIEQVNLYKEKYEKTEELRVKWYGLYQQSEKNYETAKQDCAMAKKLLTDCENKTNAYKKPTTVREKWLAIIDIISSFKK